jgi:hypothetical protein
MYLTFGLTTNASETTHGEPPILPHSKIAQLPTARHELGLGPPWRHSIPSYWPIAAAAAVAPRPQASPPRRLPAGKVTTDEGEDDRDRASIPGQQSPAAARMDVSNLAPLLHPLPFARPDPSFACRG